MCQSLFLSPLKIAIYRYICYKSPQGGFMSSKRSLTILAAALFATVAYCQTNSGAISGRVVDPSGMPIPGAEVRLTNQILKDTRGFTTTSTGDFVFTGVEPGAYSIQVKMDGFKQFEQSDLQL